MSKDKRYVVQMDMYVYAENDYMARKRAHKMKNAFDKYNRRPSVTEIGEQPFASITILKLYTMNHFANNGKEYLRKDSKYDYQGKSEEQYKGSAQICFIAFCAIGTLLAILKILQ